MKELLINLLKALEAETKKAIAEISVKNEDGSVFILSKEEELNNDKKQQWIN